MSDKSTDQSELYAQDEANEEHALLIRRTKYAAFYTVLLTGAFVFLMGPAEAVLDQEVYTPIKVIAGGAALLNLVAFVLNVWIILEKRQGRKQFREFTVTGNGTANRTSESYMDDPEVRKLMDKLAKKNQQ